MASRSGEAGAYTYEAGPRKGSFYVRRRDLIGSLVRSLVLIGVDLAIIDISHSCIRGGRATAVTNCHRQAQNLAPYFEKSSERA